MLHGLKDQEEVKFESVTVSLVGDGEGLEEPLFKLQTSAAVHIFTAAESPKTSFVNNK